MTNANDFKMGDKVILDGEYYDDGVATEHTITQIFWPLTTQSGVAFLVNPMPDTCAVDGLEYCIDSGWFTKAA